MKNLIAYLGVFILGAMLPSTDLEIDGFTKLGGSDAPAIKMKTYSGFFADSAGGGVSIDLDISASKIISYEVIGEWYLGAVINYEHENRNSGTMFYTSLERDNIENTDKLLINLEGSSTLLVEKPFKVILFYEE